METQKDLILKMLKKGRVITSRIAFQKGITRLSAIIFRLRNEGHKITSTLVYKKSARFNRVEYAEYRLAK
jgi:hypothetical protein